MKARLYKIMALTMAFVVLLTTTSFTVALHYCGETLVDYSFTHKAKDCGMEKTNALSNCEQPAMQKQSCCSDQVIIVDGQDELQDQFQKLTPDQEIFVAVFTTSYLALFEPLPAHNDSFTDYPPPFLKRDVQVLHQSFLI